MMKRRCCLGGRTLLSSVSIFFVFFFHIAFFDILFFFVREDVQQLSTLYDASRSKLMENETHSQVSVFL